MQILSLKMTRWFDGDDESCSVYMRFLLVSAKLDEFSCFTYRASRGRYMIVPSS
jgi:hypothetical protein